MTKQITVDANGDVQFTRSDDEPIQNWVKLFDAIEMVRVTDIQMDPGTGQYYILWLIDWPVIDNGLPIMANTSHALDMHQRLFGDAKPIRKVTMAPGGVMLFQTYGDAVAYEVECLRKLRIEGGRL